MNYNLQNNFKAATDLLASIKQAHPDVYAKAVPRRYIPPHGFANPNIYALVFMANEISFKRKGLTNRDGGAATICAVSERLVEFKVPTYFVKEDFARAVAATEPLMDTPLTELHWPMEAMLFVFPLDFMLEYTGTVVPFVSVVRIPKGKYIGKVMNDEDRMVIHANVFWSQDDIPTDYANCIKLSRPLKDACLVEEFVRYGRSAYIGLKVKDSQAELDCANKINSLAVKMMMVLSARRDLVEMQHTVARPAKEGKHAKEALWHPNFIGRNYRIVRDPNAPQGTHTSPQMHWRRGHMRRQRFGPLLFDDKGVYTGATKLIWIDPVLVNAPEETK